MLANACEVTTQGYAQTCPHNLWTIFIEKQTQNNWMVTSIPLFGIEPILEPEPIPGGRRKPDAP